MQIGVVKEVKPQENRVGMTPAGIAEMVLHGHSVCVESGAGVQSGFQDDDYAQVGARILSDPAEIYAKSKMIIRVKEPLPSEYSLIQEGQIVFAYFHLAAEPVLTRVLQERGAVCVAYETVQRQDGSLPLLVPMSEVAGRMAIQEGAKYMEKYYGGQGILLGGVAGVKPATVVIFGGGVVGANAAQIACGMGAKVYVLEKNLDRIRRLGEILPPNCYPVMSNEGTVKSVIQEADLIIGAVLYPGARTPRLLSKSMLSMLKPGVVLIDVAIDQGGCFESSRPTTVADPIFVEQGIVHYCVSNMPSCVPKTSTMALTNATLPYALQLADKGWPQACRDNRDLRMGLNVVYGQITHPAVAEAFGSPYTDPVTLLV